MQHIHALNMPEGKDQLGELVKGLVREAKGLEFESQKSLFYARHGITQKILLLHPSRFVFAFRICTKFPYHMQNNCMRGRSRG